TLRHHEHDAALHRVGGVVRGVDDDLRVGSARLDRREDLLAGHAGHHQVEQQHVGLVIEDHVERFERRTDAGEDAVASLLEHGAGDLTTHWVVVANHRRGLLVFHRIRHSLGPSPAGSIGLSAPEPNAFRKYRHVMRERTAVSLLVALTAALAAPYALAGTNFVLDDWFALRNAMFDGAMSAGGHNQFLAGPGAWLTYGLTFGLIGNHPLPIYLLQTAVNAAVAVALFVAVRRFLPIVPAFAVAAVWVIVPNHTSLDNWASALNISI